MTAADRAATLASAITLAMLGRRTLKRRLAVLLGALERDLPDITGAETGAAIEELTRQHQEREGGSSR